MGVCSLTIGLVALAWLVLPLRGADPELNEIATLFYAWVVPLSLGAASFLLPWRRWLQIATALQLNQGNSIVVTIEGRTSANHAGNSPSEYRVRDLVLRERPGSQDSASLQPGQTP